MSDLQRRSLASLLDVIIPSSEDGRMPSAADMDLVAYLRERAPEFVPTLVEGLAALDELCVGQEFAALTAPERRSLAQELSRAQPDMFDWLHRHTLACYYQDDRVLVGLGIGAGPALPQGQHDQVGRLCPCSSPCGSDPKLYR